MKTVAFLVTLLLPCHATIVYAQDSGAYRAAPAPTYLTRSSISYGGATSPAVYRQPPRVTYYATSTSVQPNQTPYYAPAATPPCLPNCCPMPAPAPWAPVTTYRPIIQVSPMPSYYYVGPGILGQPTVYVPGQNFRNFIRYLSP